MIYFQFIYLIILYVFGLINLWIVRQNWHKSFCLDSSPFTSPFYDRFSKQLNIINILGWVCVIGLGIYYGLSWYLSPIYIFISFRLGIKNAVAKEYNILEVLENKGMLKDFAGNLQTAKQEMERKMQFRKDKIAGKYDEYYKSKLK